MATWSVACAAACVGANTACRAAEDYPTLHTHRPTHIHTHTCTHTQIHARHICKRTHSHVYPHVHADTHVCAHMQMHAYTDAPGVHKRTCLRKSFCAERARITHSSSQIYTCMGTRTHTYAHTLVYTHVQAHMQKQISQQTYPTHNTSPKSSSHIFRLPISADCRCSSPLNKTAPSQLDTPSTLEVTEYRFPSSFSWGHGPS